MTDPLQLPLVPTTHIDPRTIVELIPGVDAVCENGHGPNCRYPFCPCFQPAEPDCDCPPGYQHQPNCQLVTGNDYIQEDT